jgi:hypothetical protein
MPTSNYTEVFETNSCILALAEQVARDIAARFASKAQEESNGK